MCTSVPVPCVVDLSASSDDENDDVVCLSEFPAHLSNRLSTRRALPGKTCSFSEVNDDALQVKTVSFTSENDDLMILEDFETDVYIRDGDEVTIHKSSKKVTEKRNGGEKPSKRSSQNSSVIDDDCCILDGDPDAPKVDTARTNCGDDSDDLVVTGESGHVACRDFPHARHLCAQFPFSTTAHKEFCPQCHCYVCEMLAPCKRWGDGTQRDDHCHASDKFGERWKILRKFNQSHQLLPAISPPQLPKSGVSQISKSTRDPPRSSSCPTPYDPFILLSARACGLLSDRSFDREGIFSDCVVTNPSRVSRELMPSPTRNTAGNESYRGLLGTRPGRSHRITPLHIALPRENGDCHSNSRPHHSPNLGAQSRFQNGYRRKRSSFLPYGTERAAECLSRSASTRRSHNNDASVDHLPHSSAVVPRSSNNNNSSVDHLPHSSSVVPSLQATRAEARASRAQPLALETSDEFSNFSILLENDLSPSAFLSHLPIGTEELQRRYCNSEATSISLAPLFGIACQRTDNEFPTFRAPALPQQKKSNAEADFISTPPHCGSAPTRRQHEVDAFGAQVGGTELWPCNAMLGVDAQLRRGGTMSDKTMDSFSPSNLLVDFLMDSASYWTDDPSFV